MVVINIAIGIMIYIFNIMKMVFISYLYHICSFVIYLIIILLFIRSRYTHCREIIFDGANFRMSQ